MESVILALVLLLAFREFLKLYFGKVYLFPFLFQDSASHPDAKVVVFVPVFYPFMRWEVFSSGIFLLLPQVLGSTARIHLLQSQFIPQLKI